MEELSRRLEELEDVLKDGELPPAVERLLSPGGINTHLVEGYNAYLVNSRERGANIVDDDILDIINDNVQLSAYNFEILQFILISLKNANAEISTLKQEIRLRNGGKAKKYTKRFRKK